MLILLQYVPAVQVYVKKHRTPVNGKNPAPFFSTSSESIAYLRGISTMVIYLTA